MGVYFWLFMLVIGFIGLFLSISILQQVREEMRKSKKPTYSKNIKAK